MTKLDCIESLFLFTKTYFYTIFNILKLGDMNENHKFNIKYTFSY